MSREMDSSRDSPNLRPNESGTDSDVGSLSPSNVSEPNLVPSSTSDSVPPQPDLEPSPRAPTPPSTRETEETEHAYWAELQEDTSTPDEEELKEIDGAEADYSACDRRCQFRTLGRRRSPEEGSGLLTLVGRHILGKQFLSGLG
jgi:hypothetical protein